jgi:hypothetical protein
MVFSPELAIPIFTLAGALLLAAIGAVRDHRASITLESKIAKLERDNAALIKEILAWRIWTNRLIHWGTHSTESPPREAPDPPDTLLEERA